MRQKTNPYLLLFCSGWILLLTTGSAFFLSHKSHREIPLSKEHELKVSIQGGLGTVSVARETHGQLVSADVESDSKLDLAEFMDYSSHDGVGYLNIAVGKEDGNDDTPKSHGVHFHGLKESNWNLELSDAIPISFDLEFGLGKGILDFTDLNVKDLSVSAGASTIEMRFDKPNKSIIEDLTIESGLSKLHAEGLCNANFNHLKFEGGVGTYFLDFGGDLKREVDVDIEVGLGALTIVLPKNIGARIIYEKSWISHLDVSKDFSEEDENNYFTSNYRSAKGKMNLRIEAGFGSVNVRRE